MVGLGFGVFFGGYLLLSYGWSQLRGCNASFISLAWPSPNGFQGCNPDPPGTPPTQTYGLPSGGAAVAPNQINKIRSSTVQKNTTGGNPNNAGSGH